MKALKWLVFSVVLLGAPIVFANAATHLSALAANEDSGANLNNNKANSTADSSDADATNNNLSTQVSTQYQQYAYNETPHQETNGQSVFVFDPNKLRWYAYDRNGELVGSGKASGGRGYCPDIHRKCKTPVGTFHVYSMGGPGCVSTKYPVGKGGAPMPYCMYFHGGFAIHGSHELPHRNASHGCIRVEPAAARWLQENVIDYGTTVIVKPY